MYFELAVSTAMCVFCALLSALWKWANIFSGAPFSPQADVVNSILVALCVQTKRKKILSIKFASTSKPQEACLM